MSTNQTVEAFFDDDGLDDYKAQTGPRVTAFALALIASYWSVMLAPVFVSGMAAPIALFAPGYVVTLGYWARATLNLPCAWRRGVWILSLFIQGAWSLAAVCFICLEGWWITIGTISTVGWWWAATIASVWCLRMEPPESAVWAAWNEEASITADH